MMAFLGASTFAFNQALQKAPSFETINKAGKAITSNNIVPKALGISIWSSDFSTASEWTIGGNGNQGAWLMDNIASLPSSPLYYSPIQSTTAANGIAYFAGIQYLLSGNVNSQNAWIQMTNSIDCSAENIVSLKFEQAYRAFNSDMTYVEVSLDGGATWVQTTDINPTIIANADATESVVTRNFDVNQSANVKFRFRWENTSTVNTAGSGYAWQIDDVDITTLADHDLIVTNHVYGTTNSGQTLYYHQIPLAQVDPIEGSAVLKNQGSQGQTNVVFTATETINGSYTGTSTPVSILSGTNDSLVISSNFSPSSIGDYQLDYSISYNNTDDIPSNNSFEPYKFSVNPSIYARDSSTLAQSGVFYGQTTGSTQTPVSSIQAGNTFVMNANANLTGIDFQFGDLINPGTLVFGEILDDNLDPIPNGETQPYTVATGDENAYQTLVFSTPISLIAGETYIVTVKSFENDFSIATAGKSAPQTSFIYYTSDATWYYTTSTPVVRMNFGPILNSTKSSISGLSQIIGTPSLADSFNVSGSNLNGDINITAPTNFEIANTSSGTYGSNLTLINAGGAISSTKIYVRLNGPTVNLTQAGNIVLSTTGSNDKTIALSGETLPECNVDITTTTNSATITANATGLNYQWFDCDDDVEITGETSVSYTATENGNYSVIITDGQCVDTSSCALIDILGLTDNEFAGVTVYPNPIQDVLKITNENGLLESLEIVTAAGRVVYTSKIYSSNFEINTSNFSKGVYFVNLRTEKIVKTFKVIK